MQLQPVVAAGMVTVQVEAVPPVPTFTVNPSVPLLFGILGLVPQVPITGAVEDAKICPVFVNMPALKVKLPSEFVVPTDVTLRAVTDPEELTLKADAPPLT
jgi:hypothetical protein